MGGKAVRLDKFLLIDRKPMKRKPEEKTYFVESE